MIYFVSSAQLGATFGVGSSSFQSSFENPNTMLMNQQAIHTYSAGIVYGFSLNQIFELQSEIQIYEDGGTYSYLNQGQLIKVNSSLSHINLPILSRLNFELNPRSKFFLELGTFLNYQINNNTTIEYNELSFQYSRVKEIENLPLEYKKFNYGFSSGAGFEYSHFIFLVRHSIGLNNILQEDQNGSRNKTRSLQFAIQYRI